MSFKKFLAAMPLLLVLATQSQGQVFKCVGKDGKTAYTDEPCKGRLIDDAQLRANTLQGGPRLGFEATRAAPGPTPLLGVCPSPLDVRNIQTAASSSRFEPGSAEYMFMQHEVHLASSCDPAVTSYTVDDWKAIRDYHSYQSRIDLRDRREARDQARRLHLLRSRPRVR